MMRARIVDFMDDARAIGTRKAILIRVIRRYILGDLLDMLRRHGEKRAVRLISVMYGTSALREDQDGPV